MIKKRTRSQLLKIKKGSKLVFFIISMILFNVLMSSEVLANIETSENMPTNPNEVDITENFTVIPGYDSYTDLERINQVVITPDKRNQRGGIWYNYELDLTKDFYIKMGAYLGTKNMSEGGADGITFTMHNDPRKLNAIGSMGGGIGSYGGAKGDPNPLNQPFIANAISVEVDTFPNYEAAGGIEMSYDKGFVTRFGGGVNNLPEQSKVITHTAFVKPGSHESVMNWDRADSGFPGHAGVITWNDVKTTRPGLFPPEPWQQWTNNKWRYLNIKWDASTKILQYSVTNDINVEMDLASTKSLQIEPLTEFGANKVFWGYTGATGAMWNEQRVAIMNYPQEPVSELKKTVKNISTPDVTFLEKTAANLDDELEYQLNIINDEDSPMPIVNGVIKDTINAGQEFINGSMKVDGVAVADPSFSSNTFTYKLPNEVKPKTSMVVTYRVKAKEAITNPLLNEFSIVSQYASDMTSNETEVYINPKITLKKAVDKNHSYVNGELVYTLKATNANKAGKWIAGNIMDNLPVNTEYIKESTKINQPGDSSLVSIADSVSWNGSFDKLVISGLTLEAGQEVTIQFKVKVLASALNKTIENIGDFKGTNINDEELTATIGKSNKVLTYIDFVHLNLRQVVIGAEQEQVIPISGYFTVLNKPALNSPITSLRANVVTESTTKDSSSEIEPNLFTETLLLQVTNTSLGYQIIDRIPEYYEYVGHIQTTDGTMIKTDHLSKNLSADAAKIQPFVDYSNHYEYWVTVYIKPKFGKDSEGKPELSPRPYSWSNVTNDFGEISVN